jgi:hypothetical protein
MYLSECRSLLAACPAPCRSSFFTPPGAGASTGPFPTGRWLWSRMGARGRAVATSAARATRRTLARSTTLRIAGWLVLRVTTDMVRTGEALTLLEAALRSRGWR